MKYTHIEAADMTGACRNTVSIPLSAERLSNLLGIGAQTLQLRGIIRELSAGNTVIEGTNPQRGLTHMTQDEHLRGPNPTVAPRGTVVVLKSGRAIKG